MNDHKRTALVAGLIGVPVSQLEDPGDGTREQFDVWTIRPNKFRVGYWDGNTFTRENPVRRTLFRYGVHDVREGLVGDHREPQYDIVFWFTESGQIFAVSDQRTGMEANRAVDR